MLLDSTLLIADGLEVSALAAGTLHVAGFGPCKVFVTLPKGTTAATLKVETKDTEDGEAVELVNTAKATDADIRLGVFAIPMPAAVKEFVVITPTVTCPTEGATVTCGVAPVCEQEGYISPANQAKIRPIITK